MLISVLRSEPKRFYPMRPGKLTRLEHVLDLQAAADEPPRDRGPRAR
jgi:hypothetical protein